MRIITGIARGVKLDTLPGEDTRPTLEVVKEAVFSSIQFELEGRHMLDLFAGSGQMGLEAVSRGCTHCTLTDSSRAAVEIITSNAKKTKLNESCTIKCADWNSYLSSVRGKKKFDLVYLDPPYAARLLPEVLKALVTYDVLADGALILCEDETYGVEKDESVLARYTLRKQARYGRAIITYFEKKGENTNE
jgi:16S rRNA (guanine966-N2)-methyltransferase